MLAQELGDKCTAFQILAQRAGIIEDRNPQPATPNWGLYAAALPDNRWLANDVCGLLLNAQAVFCRRRHQPRRPPPANSRPGRPAPTMGPGTETLLLTTWTLSMPILKKPALSVSAKRI